MAGEDVALDGGDKMDVDVEDPQTQISKKSSASTNTTTNIKAKPSRGYEITTKTIKTPPFSYACLELITSSLPPPPPPSPPNSTKTPLAPPPAPVLDAVAARSYLTSALTQFLGLTGSSISIDLLKIEGLKVWIRVPREDLAPVLAATGGWVGKGGQGSGSVGGVEERVGWRVRGSGNWLSGLVAEVEEEKIWRD